MNKFKISRETLYDDCLFNIKRGSLRILQFDTSSLNDNNTTFSFSQETITDVYLMLQRVQA